MVDYTLSGNNYGNVLKVPAWAWNYDFGIYGFGGNDALIAGNGDDDLYGGEGSDTLSGGYGWNFLGGGNGFDTADYSFFNTSSSYGLNINLATGEAWNLSAYSGEVDDILSSIEGVVGSVRADSITENYLRNVLEGNSGSDTINGAGGNDDIWGDRGADVLFGGTGEDYFIYDSIQDSNSYYGRDTIRDFQYDIDMIDLATIDARTGWSGNQAFTWMGQDATFNGAQGELHFFFVGGTGGRTTVVEGDINGDRVADIQIYLTGEKWLLGSDFIL